MTNPNWHLYWWKALPIKPLRTLEEWQEYMRPLIFVNGMGACDFLLSDDGFFAVWGDGEKRPILSEDHLVIIAARDPRFEYDMNRQPYKVKPEYQGEPEKWE